MPHAAAESPLDHARVLLRDLPAADEAARRRARARDAVLTKPPGALGRLEEIAIWLSGWRGHPPRAANIAVHVFAGNHGVAAQGVSAFPPAVTAQMVANFEAGGAAINQICAAFGLSLRVHDLSDPPTADITAGPAMTEAECAAAFDLGMNVVADDTDILILGEMGIANTTVASALYHALFGGAAADWVGRGTGIDAAALANKADVVARAVALHKPVCADAFDLLTRLGGREFAAMAGAIVAARMKRIPVILDGFMVTASAAVLRAMNAAALEHCIAGHVSAEAAHVRALDAIGMGRALLDLDMRLGEGSGAAVAAAIVKAAVATHAGMATFDAAGVSGKER